MEMTTLIEICRLILLITSYCFCAKLLSNVRFNNIKWGIISLAIFVVGYLFLRNTSVEIIYMNVVAIIISGAVIEDLFKHKIWSLLKSFVLVSCCKEIIEIILGLVLVKCNIGISGKSITLLSYGIVSIICILMTVFVRDNIKFPCKLKIKRKYINTNNLTVMTLMIAVFVLVIASVKYATPYVKNERFLALNNALIIVSYFGVAFWVIFTIYILNANDNYKRLFETEKLLRKVQNNSFEMLIVKDEETRGFRHDINNHIMCLKVLARIGDNEEINKYIDQMQMVITEIQNRYYTKGNKILDAIINYYIQLLDDDVNVIVLGECNRDLAINDMELCSILANPLQNAVEELNRQNNESKFLKIKMNSTGTGFKIEISNNSMDIALKDGLPITKKLDKENHGIGLKKVKKLVEKNNGQFEVVIKDNEFLVILILPINLD